jgi:hypothetical protein
METALGQIIYRAQNHTREGVPEMSEEDRSAIEGKKADNFNNIIQVMKAHKILEELGADIYEELHDLRKYRNKVHIYLDVEIEGVSRDENAAFSEDICTWALKLNVRILKYLSAKRLRPKGLRQYVAPLRVPSPAQEASEGSVGLGTAAKALPLADIVFSSGRDAERSTKIGPTTKEDLKSEPATSEKTNIQLATEEEARKAAERLNARTEDQSIRYVASKTCNGWGVEIQERRSYWSHRGYIHPGG